MYYNMSIRNCQQCGKEFSTNPARAKRFCSILCASKRVISDEHKKKNSLSNKGKKLSESTKKKISISHMGKKVSPELRKKMSIRMSLQNKGNKIMLGKKHSPETKKKISESHKGKKLTQEHIDNLIKTRPRGDKHSAWKGGITSEGTKIRRSTEGRLWIYSVFVRDSFTCQKCQQLGKTLNAHHILNFSTHPELRFAIDNGITFCKPCHKEFHKKYGVKNNSREELIEFLK